MMEQLELPFRKVVLIVAPRNAYLAASDAADDLEDAGYDTFTSQSIFSMDGTRDAAAALEHDLHTVLAEVDAVYAVLHWQQDKAARLIVAVAQELGLPIFSNTPARMLKETVITKVLYANDRSNSRDSRLRESEVSSEGVPSVAEGSDPLGPRSYPDIDATPYTSWTPWKIGGCQIRIPKASPYTG